MIGAGLAILGALAIAARAAYPVLIERRFTRRRPVDRDGIVVGAKPIELARTNAPGVLVLHGGGDTPQIVRALSEHLHQNGYSVHAPLLSGHGRAISAWAEVSAATWHEDVVRAFEAMRTTHDRVSVVGLSMGGALAVTLAAEREDLSALVLLAPYVEMPQPLQRLARSQLLWGWMLPYFSSFGEASVRDPDAAAKTLGYGMFTPAALRALYEVMERASRDLSRVVAPTLIVQSRDDNRLPPASATRALDRLGAREKKLEWVEGAGHVITVDYGRERVFALVESWLEEFG
jgi:carboxylesterase